MVKFVHQRDIIPTFNRISAVDDTSFARSSLWWIEDERQQSTAEPRARRVASRSALPHYRNARDRSRE